MSDTSPIEDLLNKLGLVIQHAVDTNQQNANSFQQLTNAILQQNENRVPQERTLDVLSRSIEPFAPNKSTTFKSWYNRHSDVFERDGERLEDPAKTRLLLRKLNQEAYEKYSNILLPREPRDLTFQESIDKLTAIFCESESTFQLRFKCFNAEKSINEDFLSYGARINRICESATISTMTPNQFKCLVFLTGLKSGVDTDVKTRLLTLIEDGTNADLSIDTLVNESRRLMTLKVDAATLDGHAYRWGSL